MLNKDSCYKKLKHLLNFLKKMRVSIQVLQKVFYQAGIFLRYYTIKTSKNICTKKTATN